MTYKPFIMCYGNTRSNILTAAVKIHLARLGINDINVRTAGLARVVEKINQKANTTNVPLGEATVSSAARVDPDYGKLLGQARRCIATPNILTNSDVILVADQNLAREVGELATGLDFHTILEYAGHEAPVWQYDLDDASVIGALEVINARQTSHWPEERINAAIESEQFKYHAPLGGDYKIGSPEAKHTEVKQIFNLGKIVAVEMVRRSRK